FHYDPSLISIAEIETMAKEAGASITAQYGHLLIESSKVWQPRHARLLEIGINKVPGVLNAAVSGTGFVQLEYERTSTSEDTILNELDRLGIRAKKNVEGAQEPHKTEEEH